MSPFRSRRRFFPGLSLLLASFASVPAQTAPSVAKTRSEEALVLAPFQVVTSNDDGWVAGNTMLGNRTNQPLKDTPISIDALTKEFLMDVGAFTPEEAGLWVANVAVQPDMVTRSDLGNFNFRGLSNQFSANRNFFRWYGPQDNFDVERIDFGRGSNTLIFGDNDPGGQATTYTKRALPGRSFTKALVQGGSWGSYRGELDHNRSINQDLALRVNVVNRTDYRNFDWNKFNYRGYHIGLTYQPFKHTGIRIEGERSGNYRVWGDNNLLIRERGFTGLGFTNRLTVLPNGKVVNNTTLASGTPNNTALGDGTTYLTARDRTNPTGGTGGVLNFLDHDTARPLLSNFTYHGLPEHYSFAGPASVNNRTYTTWSTYIEHRFSEKLAMDVAFNQQNQWLENIVVGSNTIANEDVAGRLFTDATYNPQYQRNHMSQYRVSFAYNFDRWKWMQQFFVVRGEYRDDRNVNHQEQQRTFGPDLGVSGVQPFQRVFFTDPYPGAALTIARFLQNAPPGTRMFGNGASGQNHLARAHSISSSGKYFGGRVQTLLGARLDDNFTWSYNATVNGLSRDPVTGEVFSLGDRRKHPELWTPTKTFDVEKWSYNAGLVFMLSPSVNLYYTYSTSFRFGGVDNLILDPTGPLVGTTNEVGAKASFLKDKLVWNVAAYDLVRDNINTNIIRTGITDAQMDAFINYGLTPASPEYRAIRTGGASPDVTSQKSRGLESTFTFYPANGLSVRVSGAYKQVTFVDAFPILKQLIAATEARGPITDPDVRTTIQKLKDTAYVQGATGRFVTGAFPAVTAPLSFNYAFNYRFDRGSRLRGWSAGVNGNYSGNAVLRYVGTFPDNRNVKGGETYAVNASLAYRTKLFDHVTSFNLNVSNILATKYPILSAAALLDGSNYFRRYYGQPPSFRLTASTEF